MSPEELKAPQFAILLELLQLVCCKLQVLACQMRQVITHCCVVQGTCVSELVGEALLATDKRHCAALVAILRERQ